ncbi:MAG TPA: hypothetical protein PLP23_09030 [Panacibacter sp.]|nr:hypothetical protein [Panacibacter sp.]
MEKKYEISYNSDDIIGDKTELSTLSIFYDKIILPYSDAHGDLTEIRKNRKGLHEVISMDMTSKIDFNGQTILTYEIIPKWEKENGLLFNEGVLERLPKKDKLDVRYDQNVSDIAFLLLKTPSVFGFTEDPNTFMVRTSVIEHLFRQDLNLPGIFTVRQGHSKREVYKAIEALHVFKYLLPQVSALNPEDILKIRERVKDTREGFAMHLQKLSADVEAGLNADAKYEEISSEALKIIETSLIPDYREFVRQLRPERVGFGGRILDAAGKILEIDAAPWTPKFWGQTLQALGTTIGLLADNEKDLRTNEKEAFRFMHLCETIGGS